MTFDFIVIAQYRYSAAKCSLASSRSANSSVVQMNKVQVENVNLYVYSK